jgi:putative SOS response-associated peptidase YedK
MCGRYGSYLPPDEIARLFQVPGALPNFAPSWNVAPSQPAPVIRLHPTTGARHLDLLTWGFIPYWTKSSELKKARKPINASVETAATSLMFRGAYQERRCLVHADNFYEWYDNPDKGKQPYAFARRNGQPLALAGLWDRWRGEDGTVIRSFVILTSVANGFMAPIHDRMPVIVEPQHWAAWLGETEADPAQLVHPSDEGTLRKWPISTKVNSPKNNGPDLLEPVESAEPKQPDQVQRSWD